MINLIRNELTKISKKKSIYITLLVTLVFVIITNIICNIDINDFNYDVTSDIEFYEEEIASLNLNDSYDLEIFEGDKTQLEILKLVKKYGYTSWQANVIYIWGTDLISQMVHYQYVEPDKELYDIVKKDYDDMIAKLDKGDWRYFVQEDLKETEEQIADLKSMKDMETNEEEISNIEYQLEQLEIGKQIDTWRLEKDICYGEDYYNECLSNYQMEKINIKSYETQDQSDKTEKEKHQSKLSYYESLENLAISQYDIEHGTHIGDESTAKGLLFDTFSQFEIFIIIMAIMIAGTIVSEEFNKGTIKLLLIKPYKRVKILTAKFITALVMLIIVIIAVMLMQTVVGGIIQGFDSFGEPTVVYNHNTNQLEEINIIKYLALQTLGKLPIYILLMTLAFALSTIFTNSALAITIGLLGYMGAPIITQLADIYNVSWIKFFVTPNWDLTQYLFGGLPDMAGITLGFSIAIILIYMVIMLVPTYIVFKKKNIKNI